MFKQKPTTFVEKIKNNMESAVRNVHAYPDN